MLLHKIEFALVGIGAINWGFIGVGGFMGADWNLVHMLLGSWPMVEWVVYILVGLSAIMLCFSHKKDCRVCNASGM